MKKIKVLLLATMLAFTVLSLCCVTPLKIATYAEEEEQIEEVIEEVEQTPSCTVSLSDTKNGTVLFDVESGEVGDVVTVYPTADVFFLVSKVTANGEELTADENGVYHFALIDGENNVEVEFEFDKTKIGELIAFVKDSAVTKSKELFTVDNLLKLITIVITLIMGSSLCVTTLKSQKIKAKTVEEVSDAITEISKSEIAKAVKEKIQEELGPKLEKANLNIEEISEVCSTMARCFVLAQEDTPEARLAIIQELSKNNKKAKEISEAVSNAVIEKKEEEQKIKEEQAEKIRLLEAKNEALVSTEEEKEDGITGRV